VKTCSSSKRHCAPERGGGYGPLHCREKKGPVPALGGGRGKNKGRWGGKRGGPGICRKKGALGGGKKRGGGRGYGGGRGDIETGKKGKKERGARFEKMKGVGEKNRDG